MSMKCMYMKKDGTQVKVSGLDWLLRYVRRNKISEIKFYRDPDKTTALNVYFDNGVVYECVRTDWSFALFAAWINKRWWAKGLTVDRMDTQGMVGSVWTVGDMSVLKDGSTIVGPLPRAEKTSEESSHAAP